MEFLPSFDWLTNPVVVTRQFMAGLANGMLLVATFSLSTMIMAYSFASNSTTPRVTELLLEDASAQNAADT